jgi:hypothetical protein
MSGPKPQVEEALALLNAPLVKRDPIAPRSRWVYLVLAITLGLFGAHNWFARRYVSAGVQVVLWVFAFSVLVTVVIVGTEGGGDLIITMMFFLLFYPVFMCVWILIELGSVKECGDGAMLEWSA